MADDECNFKEKLRELCEEFDAYAGEYPESQYQGRALYDFYLEKYHQDTAQAEIDQYYHELEVERKKAEIWWFEKLDPAERDKMIREKRIDRRFLSEYNKEHGTNY